MGATNAKRNTNGSRLSNRDANANTQPADWGDAHPQLLQSAVVTLAKLGGALRFGYTRDGGAYAIGIYLDGDYRCEYVRPSENIDDYLRGLCEEFAQ